MVRERFRSINLSGDSFRVTKHRIGCRALPLVRMGKKSSVWMTPQLNDQKVFFVCADPDCRAQLIVVDLERLKLPPL